MKKRLPSFILCLLLVLSLCLSGSAQRGSILTTFYITSPNNGPVNLRTQPSRHSQLVARLVTGTSVVVEETDAQWSRVKVKDMEGYVLNQYLSSVNPTGKIVDSSDAKHTMYVDSPNASSVNMRETPDVTGDLVRRVSEGTAVEILGKEGDWSLVRLNGETGYILSEYLTSSDPLFSENNDPQMQYMFVHASNASPINMRESPSTLSKLVTKLLSGSVVEVLEIGKEWAKVSANDHIGYVMTAYLTWDVPKSVDQSVLATVVTKDGKPVRVRYGAGKGYDVVCEIDNGTHFHSNTNRKINILFHLGE